MGRKRREEHRIHYRYYPRLVGYLRHHKLRVAVIILVLIGEAWFTIFGLALMKPVLDLVFLGRLIEVPQARTEAPLVDVKHYFAEQRLFVERLGGELDRPGRKFSEEVLAWLDRPDVDAALLDLRGLTGVTEHGWATLVDLGLNAEAAGHGVTLLTDTPPPGGFLPPRLEGSVKTPAEAPELVALADRVRAPETQARTPRWYERWKTAAIERFRGPLDRLQSYAIQSSAHKYRLLEALAGLLLIITVLRCICGFFAGYLTDYVADAVMRRIRDELYSHMLCLDDRFFTSRNVGALMSHITQDVGVVDDSINVIFLGILKGPINLFSVLGAMIFISPSLTLYTLIMFPALLLPMWWVAHRVRRYSRQSQEKKSRMSVVLHETFAGIRIVRAYSTENREVNRFRRENWRLFKYKIRSAMADAGAAQTTILLSTIAACAVLLLNGYYIIELGTLSGSDFIIFLALMFTLYRPLKGMTSANNKIIKAMAGAERFFKVMDRPTEIVEKPGAVELGPLRRTIQFDNVTFAYSEKTEPVLRDIDLAVDAGRVIAIVGSSGAGKTTLVNLLPRFWDPTSGRVLIDGVDICDVTLRSLRRQIAIVTQESILFDDTVRNNIAYGQEEIDDERIIEAAKAANAHSFIMEFPKGYGSVIGDRGQRISGGQRQRLAIARALIKNAPILILDEATSSLDTEAEREVQAAIDRLITGRTAFVIAHRLSTIVNADEIIVLKDGRIIERGHHSELLVRGGEYAKLHRLQFAAGESPEPSPAALAAERSAGGR
jgi:subfamily B ATP-binding cassette protein MsbA